MQKAVEEFDWLGHKRITNNGGTRWKPSGLNLHNSENIPLKNLPDHDALFRAVMNRYEEESIEKLWEAIYWVYLFKLRDID